MRKNYKLKRTISMKQFISEFGESFSDHMKERLLELEVRCVLTRKEEENKLDLKHVEHTKYDSKEYAYGQLIANEGELYFSEKCMEGPDVMENPVVDPIYNALKTEEVVINENIKAKKVDDSNIDYIIDNILEVCPQVTDRYLEIMSKYL
ncbi:MULTISPECIES: hypothetical protein [unclassified Clostridium]|uniref:hypothetical protein n=1 Tax=unclassified Clostridium TaxID=2614128 RepID=UPI00052BF997|nr:MULTISPECIES: hypothetical protein [unclassified Clostridium]KGK85983.1 hypothetical protein DP68_14190 [Clostridium sp. HMP27]